MRRKIFRFLLVKGGLTALITMPSWTLLVYVLRQEYKRRRAAARKQHRAVQEGASWLP